MTRARVGEIDHFILVKWWPTYVLLLVLLLWCDGRHIRRACTRGAFIGRAFRGETFLGRVSQA